MDIIYQEVGLYKEKWSGIRKHLTGVAYVAKKIEELHLWISEQIQDLPYEY